MGWVFGCNYLPSTAVNPIEMWQADSFDEETISRELAWAAELGMTMIRVFLHDLMWLDGEAFLDRVDRVLAIAESAGLDVMVVLFDDCWSPNPHRGPQGEPIAGVHNSRWSQSPGADRLVNPEDWKHLKAYTQAVTARFAQDPRVVLWDVYNEPGNSGWGAKTAPLLSAVFEWVREIDPSQPLTSAPWTPAIGTASFEWGAPPEVTDVQFRNSDVITFHAYDGPELIDQLVIAMGVYGRPILCTETFARQRQRQLDVVVNSFRKHQVGMLIWGLVAGRSQAYLPWTEHRNDGDDVWFHDLLHRDGKPYDIAEIGFLKKGSETAS